MCLSQELNRGHPGVVRMKQVAPRMVAEHRQRSGGDGKWLYSLSGTQECPSQSAITSLVLDWCPVDFLGAMLLVVTDAHSKWPEVSVMTSTMATKTIAVL